MKSTPHRRGWNVSTVVVWRLVAVGAVAVSTLLNARWLAAAEFGQMVLALSIASLSGVLGTGGLGRLALREIPSAGGSQPPSNVATAVLNRQLGWMALSSFVAGIVGYLLLEDPSPTVLLLVMCLSLVNSRLAVVADILRSDGSVVVPLLLMGRGGAPAQLAIGSFCTWIVVAATELQLSSLALLAGFLVVGLVVVGSVEASVRTRFRALTSVKISTGSGVPFLGTQMATSANGQIDIWLGGLLLMGESLGTYAAVSRLVSLSVIPFQSVQQMTMPLVSARLALGERLGLSGDLRAMATKVFIVSLPLFSALLLAPQLIIGLAYGDGFPAEGAGVLTVLAIGQLLNLSTGFGGPVATMGGQERRSMTAGIGGTVLTAVLSFPLVAAFDAAGLAVAAAAGSTAAFIRLAWVASNKVGVPTSVSARAFRGAGR